MPDRENSASIMTWSEATFGPASNLVALVARAEKEMAELRQALEEHEPSDAVVMEAADVVIVLARLTGLLGTDLGDAVDRKMAVNRARRWSPSGDGTGQHV